MGSRGEGGVNGRDSEVDDQDEKEEGETAVSV